MHRDWEGKGSMFTKWLWWEHAEKTRGAFKLLPLHKHALTPSLSSPMSHLVVQLSLTWRRYTSAQGSRIEALGHGGALCYRWWQRCVGHTESQRRSFNLLASLGSLASKREPNWTQTTSNEWRDINYKRESCLLKANHVCCSSLLTSDLAGPMYLTPDIKSMILAGPCYKNTWAPLSLGWPYLVEEECGKHVVELAREGSLSCLRKLECSPRGCWKKTSSLLMQLTVVYGTKKQRQGRIEHSKWVTQAWQKWRTKTPKRSSTKRTAAANSVITREHGGTR